MASSAREMIDSRPAKVEQAKPLVDIIRKQYESGFERCRIIGPPESIPFSLAPVGEPPALGTPLLVYKHQEIGGTGDTAEEAIQDWKTRLDAIPQSGTEIIWRVPPEIDCWLDFVRQKEIWKVYARVVIIP